MRHLPLVGHLPTSPFVTRYLLVKQDNNGDTFLIWLADPAELPGHAAAAEIVPRAVGAWAPPNARDLRLDEPQPGITPAGTDPAEPPFWPGSARIGFRGPMENRSANNAGLVDRP